DQAGREQRGGVRSPVERGGKKRMGASDRGRISRACEAKRKEAGKRREVREAGSDPERAWDTPPGCNLLEPSALNPPALGPFIRQKSSRNGYRNFTPCSNCPI